MYARVRQFRVPGGVYSEQKRGVLQTLTLRRDGIHLSIDVYADEASARAATSSPDLAIESDEVWNAGLLRLTDEGHAFLADRKRSLARFRLSRALAERLVPVVPSDFVEQELAAWFSEATTFTFEEPELDARAAAETATWRALDRLQDDIAETTHDPWPRPERRHQPLPDVNVELRDEALHIWWGAEHDPVLQLEPIPLPELGL
jgi:hypothetical protein